MAKPDTLLAAARKLAIATNIPWSQVHRHYRALQHMRAPDIEAGWRGDGESVGWLPLSRGSGDWLAEPLFLGRLLVSVACVEPAIGAAWVRLSRQAALESYPRYFKDLQYTFEGFLAELLVDQGRKRPRFSVNSVQLVATDNTIVCATGAKPFVFRCVGAETRAVPFPIFGPCAWSINYRHMRNIGRAISWARPDQQPDFKIGA